MYPDEYQEEEDDCVDIPYSVNRNWDMGGDECGEEERFASEERSPFATHDPYADEAELAIRNGDCAAAMDALGSSIAEYNNINSVKRMGELLFAVFLEAYADKSLDGRDREGMGLAQTVIAMFYFYMTVKSATGEELSPEEEEEIQENLQKMAVFFRDIRDFHKLCDLVEEKLKNSDLDTIINQFLHGGFA